LSPAAGEILVTGLGVVSPLGIGRAAVTRALQEDRIGISDLTLFAPPGNCEHAAEVTGYDAKDFVFSKQTYLDRCTELAIGAARLALEDAGLSLPVAADADPIGLCFGSTWGCLDSAERFHEPLAQGKAKTASSLVFSHSYPNCPTSFVAIELGLRGYSTSFAGSRLAGFWALRSALDALAAGTAARILVGASDALSPAVFAHLESQASLPVTRGQVPSLEDPQIWSRVPGEAAVFVLLETAAATRAHTAPPRARLHSITDAASPTTLDWRCGDLHAAGPLWELVRQILGGEPRIRVGLQTGSECLTLSGSAA